MLLGAVKTTNPEPSVALVSATPSASEATGAASVGVQLTTSGGGPLACPITVNVSTALATGTAPVPAMPTDFTTASGVLTFAAGTASGTTLPWAIALTNDPIDESDEVVRAKVDGAIGAHITVPAEALVTIM